MGMFDSVKVPCPKCGHIFYAQSKGGDCVLANYELGTAPLDVMTDVNRHPMECEECGARFKVDVALVPSVMLLSNAVTRDKDDEGEAQ